MVLRASAVSDARKDEYVERLRLANITGLVLSVCELESLKLEMNVSVTIFFFYIP